METYNNEETKNLDLQEYDGEESEDEFDNDLALVVQGKHTYFHSFIPQYFYHQL